MINAYKFLTKTFLILVLVVLTSCSWIGVREPAAKKSVPSISIDDVFSIESGTDLVENDLKDQFLHSLKINYTGGKLNYIAEISKDLPDNVAFKLEFDVVDDNYIVRILHSKNAFRDKDALYELGRFISSSFAFLQHPLLIYEMYYNAHEGDPVALENFLKMKEAENVSFNFPGITPSSDIVERQERSNSMRAELVSQIKELKLQRKILADKRKALMDKLDKAPDAKQLKTLVAKGDRNGVADLLKKYLPWEEMAPFEKRFWETHLEAIRNPVPIDQRVLIYRGLQGDFIHSARITGQELDKEEAIKQSKAFVMSTVLVKNQGSWNRRLRSLESMNDKFIATLNDSREFSQSARISTMFLKHSDTPEGSPFLSFTPDYDIAHKFGSNKMMSALIDPRVLQFNYASGFSSETEFLLPLVTFPDEMAGLWQIGYENGVDAQTYLEERLKMRITEEFGKGKADEIIKRIKKNSADFFGTVFKNGETKNVKVKGGNMASFYKKFSKVSDIKPALTSDGNLICKDLLKIFWAVP